MTRTFWLSFVDPEKPEGQRFMGVCVVDVDAHEASSIKAEIDDRFPRHQEGAEWIAAATRKAWALGCNPGGEVGCCEIPATEPIPRNRLLDAEEAGLWGGQRLGHA